MMGVPVPRRIFPLNLLLLPCLLTSPAVAQTRKPQPAPAQPAPAGLSITEVRAKVEQGPEGANMSLRPRKDPP
jgi:hypothetical protein